MSLSAQPQLVVTPWEYNEVTLARFDPADHSSFAKLFQHPTWNDQRPYALLLKNNTPRRVTAVTVIWKTDAPNFERKIIFGDSYSKSGKRELVAARGEAVVSPLGVTSAEIAEKGFKWYQAFPSNWKYVEAVTVSLDTVIFEDGRVIGPDESQTVSAIMNRKVAAERTITLVNTAMQHGRDVNAALNESSTFGADPLDYFHFFTARYSREVLRRTGVDRTVYLEQLRNLPQLPTFVRNR